MWVQPREPDPVSGLRTRYRPRHRLGGGLAGLAPWLDLGLIVVFFLLIRNTYVITPGVVIELPTAPVRGGALTGMTMVVLSVGSDQPGVRDEIVVFNDQRYRLAQEAQLELLRQQLVQQAERLREGTLLVEADARVQHGTLVRLYALAREAGLKEVNVAARPAR